MADSCKELLVGLPVCLGDRGNPVLSRLQIRKNDLHLLIHVLIQGFLLIHIEGGKPVVRHQNHIDVGDRNSALLT